MFLYTSRKDERITIPARHIEDVELSDSAFGVDFELGKRYQEFLREMVRFALLGIAGYGFLIKEVIEPRGNITTGQESMILVSLICLACAVGFGLYCGELDKACLRMQITILRLLQRLSSEKWTNPAYSSPEEVASWQKTNRADLDRIRDCQKHNLQRARHMLRSTVWSLGLGIVLTSAAFMWCLHSTMREVRSALPMASASEPGNGHPLCCQCPQDQKPGPLGHERGR